MLCDSGSDLRLLYSSREEREKKGEDNNGEDEKNKEVIGFNDIG